MTIIWRMRFACWVTKTTDNNGYTNAPQCYVMRTLLVLLSLGMIFALTFTEISAVESALTL